MRAEERDGLARLARCFTRTGRAGLSGPGEVAGQAPGHRSRAERPGPREELSPRWRPWSRLIRQRDAAITRQLGKYQASPGYDGTGYVEYSTVTGSQRRQLAGVVNALAETMSKISVQVS